MSDEERSEKDSVCDECGKEMFWEQTEECPFCGFCCCSMCIKDHIDRCEQNHKEPSDSTVEIVK